MRRGPGSGWIRGMRVSMSVAEMGSQEPSEPPSPGDATQNSARPADRHGLLKHSCGFLDFWDIAKPEQETRLAATKLPEYLRARPKMERRVWGRGRALPDKEAAAGPGFGMGARGREPG
uniref:myb-binding protein 1A-like n=1 Tax=Callithrix jacchus TaxID=9483 RepID=UPI0023DD26AE|nr:myb-binding protein 1A-like [Callithrix jacchus]